MPTLFPDFEIDCKTMTYAKIQTIAGITTVVALVAGGIGPACIGTLGAQFGRGRKPVVSTIAADALSARSAHSQKPDVPTTVKTNAKDGAAMALIPAGKFRMGSPMAEIDTVNRQVTDDFFKSEGPEHEVTLDAYFIYRTPVTVAQYMRFCDETGHGKPSAPDFNPNWSRKDHPIVNVSYEDALAYCKWASGNKPGSVRLPTEAEWEKAARGGLAGARYPWGDEFDAGRLWCSKHAEDDAGGTQAVASFAPNGYGLYDMAGNVWQWCSDWFDAGFYANALATKPNPENRTFGAMKARVVRGGSWGDFNPMGFRCAGRIFRAPAFTDKHFGFRCVSVKPK